MFKWTHSKVQKSQMYNLMNFCINHHSKGSFVSTCLLAVSPTFTGNHYSDFYQHRLLLPVLELHNK